MTPSTSPFWRAACSSSNALAAISGAPCFRGRLGQVARHHLQTCDVLLVHRLGESLDILTDSGARFLSRLDGQNGFRSVLSGRLDEALDKLGSN